MPDHFARLAMITVPGGRLPQGQGILSPYGLIVPLHVVSGLSSPVEMVSFAGSAYRRDLDRVIEIPGEDAAVISGQTTEIKSLRECGCGTDISAVRIEFVWRGPNGFVTYNAWPTQVRRLVRVRQYSYLTRGGRYTIPDAGMAFLAVPGRPGLSGSPVTCECGGLLGLLHGNVQMNGDCAVCLIA